MDENSVDDVLGADHRRLDGLLDRIAEALASRSGAAGASVSDFERSLVRHMDWEESVLFPAVRERTSAAGRRSLESLEIDHERIRETLAALRNAVGDGSWDSAASHLDRLRVYLQGHNYDEEHGVYVEADRLFDEGTRRELLGRFPPDPGLPSRG